jgi:PAS domain S-box-containing protein
MSSHIRSSRSDALPSDEPAPEAEPSSEPPDVEPLTSAPDASPRDPLRTLLSLALNRLGLETGCLCRIEVGPGTHSVVETCGTEAPVGEQSPHDLEATFCRATVVSSAPVAVHDAPNQGWSEDRAFTSTGLHTYIGAKVVVDGQLYGTICFTAEAPRATPFSDADRALVEGIAERVETLLEHRSLDASPPALSGADDLLRHVEALPEVGGWALDLETGAMTWTPYTCRVHGRPPGDAPSLDDALSDYVEGDRARFRSVLERCAETGRPFDEDFSLMGRDGTRRRVRLRGLPRRDDGAVTRIVGTLELLAERDQQAARPPTGTQLEALVEESIPIVFMLDASGEVLLSEGRDLKSLGRSPGEDVGASVYELFEASPAVQAVLDRALSGASVHETLEIRGHTFEVHAAPFHDDEGTLAGCIGTAADVTDKARMQTQLREERDLLNRVIETSPSAVAILDREGHFVRVSERAQEILGLDEEEITRRRYDDPDWNITAPDGRPLPEQELPFHKVKAAGESLIGMEHAVHRPDGSRRLLSVSGSPLFDAEGTFVGAVFHLDDVTPHRKAEVNLRLFRSAVEQAQEAMLILEGTPRTPPGPPVSYANPALASLTGYAPEAVRGRSLSFLFGPETAPEALGPLWDAFENGTQAEGEAVVHRADGSSFVTRWSLAPVRDEGGRISHWLWIQRDVTDLRQTRRRLLKAHDVERRRIDQEMHDQMGGQLTALQMTVELARMEATSDAVADHLDTIEQRVSDLATVTRSISRRLQPEVLLDRGLRPALSALVSRLESRHDLRIETQCDLPLDPPLPPVLELAAYYVTQELLVHAARSAEASTIQLHLGSAGRRLRLRIRTSAMGVSPLAGTGDEPHALQEVRTWVNHLNGTVELRTTGDEEELTVVLPLELSARPSGARRRGRPRKNT